MPGGLSGCPSRISSAAAAARGPIPKPVAPSLALWRQPPAGRGPAAALGPHTRVTVAATLTAAVATECDTVTVCSDSEKPGAAWGPRRRAVRQCPLPAAVACSVLDTVTLAA